MPKLRLLAALVVMVPAWSLLGAFATLDSGASPYVGLVGGGLVGVFFGLAFGGAKGRWLDVAYGPEATDPDEHDQGDRPPDRDGPGASD